MLKRLHLIGEIRYKRRQEESRRNKLYNNRCLTLEGFVRLTQINLIYTPKKNSEFNKIFNPTLSIKFLIKITKFLLSLQYFI